MNDRKATTGAGWRLPTWGTRGTTGAAIPAELTVENVSFAYRERQVLSDVSLTVAPGEVLGLLGHSGCGKTTLLRLIAGLERPSAGRILFDRREVASERAFVESDRRGVGLVFQDYALFPHLTVVENIRFGLVRMPAAEQEMVARRVLARVGLADHAGSYPHMLSGGEQQRVALARAVAPRPGVILMDEPFSNLDRRMRDAVRDETVALLRETRATAVIVTHDPEEAMRISDRIALMRAGRFEQVGPAQELYERPANPFCARFFCDFNEIVANVKGGRVETPLGLFPAPGLTDGARALVLVRPQALSLKPAGFCIPGRLMEKRFLGEVWHAEIALPGLERPVRLRLASGIEAAAGSEIGVDVDARGVLVFAAADA